MHTHTHNIQEYKHSTPFILNKSQWINWILMKIFYDANNLKIKWRY